MNEIEIIENLLDSASKISYSNKEEFNLLEKRTEMIVHKLFGDDSHYLKDLKSISYSPNIIIGGSPTDWSSYFESGLKKFRNLLQVMIEDKKINSNYQNEETTSHIKSETKKSILPKSLKEVKILIASPGDVKIERELLMDKLETKFRRENFEERCGARIIVNGWENVASQSGYPQDIINDDLVKNADIVLAVFRHKLGSETINTKTGKARALSGTAEEILFAIRNKTIPNPPLGMAYFYSIAPVISLDSIDKEKVEKEWIRLKEFKKGIQNEILYKGYSLEEQILDIVCTDLCDNIIKYFK